MLFLNCGASISDEEFIAVCSFFIFASKNEVERFGSDRTAVLFNSTVLIKLESNFKLPFKSLKNFSLFLQCLSVYYNL